eukprot:scaffold167_cov347-Prasinococcus_capsulatus_cf.AAC.16
MVNIFTSIVLHSQPSGIGRFAPAACPERTPVEWPPQAPPPGRPCGALDLDLAVGPGRGPHLPRRFAYADLAQYSSPTVPACSRSSSSSSLLGTGLWHSRGRLGAGRGSLPMAGLPARRPSHCRSERAARLRP